MKKTQQLMFTFILALSISFFMGACTKEIDTEISTGSFKTIKELVTEQVQSSNTEYTKDDTISFTSEYHPIVIANLFLGGYRDKQWLKAEDIQEEITGGEKYCLYSQEKLLEIVDGVKPSYSEASGNLKLSIVNEEDNNKYLVAISAEWDILPKEPKEVEVTTSYENAVSKILNKHGVNTKPIIQKAYSLDLYNDGNEEIIIEACNIQSTIESEKNQYSIILILEENQGEMNSVILRSFINNSDSKDILTWKNYIYGFVDINGDKKVEIIVRSSYYEGESYSIYEFVNGEYEAVLTASNGA